MSRRDPAEREAKDDRQAETSKSSPPPAPIDSHRSAALWLAAARQLLSSWSLRIGLLLLLPILLYLPWRQEFIWRVGEDGAVPVQAVRHRFFWDPPWNSRLDVLRLLSELVALAALVMLAYLYEKTWRRARRPTKDEQAYIEKDWQEEVRRRDEGHPPSACPTCGRTGFYGPREDSAGRHLRHCSFCGFQQSVGGKPTRLIPCVHDCGKVSWIAGAPQIVWIAGEQETFECQFCGSSAEVEVCKVTSPVDDPIHPWWDVPQNLSREEYALYWLRNGAPGRVYN